MNPIPLPQQYVVQIALQYMHPEINANYSWYDAEEVARSHENAEFVNIEFCIGVLPDLCRLTNMRRLRMYNCVGTDALTTTSFPDWIEELHIETTNLTNITRFPKNLKRLLIQRTNLSTLPPFPTELMYLVCHNNHYLTNLPAFPRSLLHIACSFNKLMRLPSLPPDLYTLICFDNLLEDLPRIPPKLRYLACESNPLDYMPIHGINSAVVYPKSVKPTRFAELEIVRKIQAFRELYYTIKYGRVLMRKLMASRSQIQSDK